MKEEFFYINHSDNLAHTNTKENKTLSLFLLYSFIINWKFQLYFEQKKNADKKKTRLKWCVYTI